MVSGGPPGAPAGLAARNTRRRCVARLASPIALPATDAEPLINALVARHPFLLDFHILGTWLTYIGLHTGCIHIFFGTISFPP